jgi:hypothetical protein
VGGGYFYDHGFAIKDVNIVYRLVAETWVGNLSNFGATIASVFGLFLRKQAENRREKNNQGNEQKAARDFLACYFFYTIALLYRKACRVRTCTSRT